MTATTILIIGIITFIIGVVAIIISDKHLKQNIKDIEDAHRQEINEALKDAEKSLEIAQKRVDDVDQTRIVKEKQLEEELTYKKTIGELQLKQDYEKLFQELKEKYQDAFDEYTDKIVDIDTELIQKQQILNNYRSLCEATNEAILRKKQMEEEEEFFTVQLTDNDKEDISTLQQMDLRLHNRNVIPKLIWDLFIKRPTDELIKRQTSGRSISGIYKITNKETGEAYIGRTTDISTRWKNHIKTAIGLGSLASSTLHTRLAKDGLWNYTFEIIEEVPKDNLSKRESYYIELYGTKNQLNMKNGDKNGTQ